MRIFVAAKAPSYGTRQGSRAFGFEPYHTFPTEHTYHSRQKSHGTQNNTTPSSQTGDEGIQGMRKAISFKQHARNVLDQWGI